jgi:hypothetical protein
VRRRRRRRSRVGLGAQRERGGRHRPDVEGGRGAHPCARRSVLDDRRRGLAVGGAEQRRVRRAARPELTREHPARRDRFGRGGRQARAGRRIAVGDGDAGRCGRARRSRERGGPGPDPDWPGAPKCARRRRARVGRERRERHRDRDRPRHERGRAGLRGARGERARRVHRRRRVGGVDGHVDGDAPRPCRRSGGRDV